MTDRQTFIVRRWREGATLPQIAAELGSTANSVNVTVNRLRRRGHELPYRRNLEQPVHPRLRLAPEGKRRCSGCGLTQAGELFAGDYLCAECRRATDREAGRRHSVRHPHKRAARNAIALEVRMGRMAAPDACERCGAEGELHAHHPDYDRPLEVEWICPPCHRREHDPEREAAAAPQRSAA